MTYTALQVADEIMRLANDEDRNITRLKLIKICYFVQGWSLGVLGKKMFDDEIEAWMHGPVIPEVYRRFKFYNGCAISYEPGESVITDAEDKELIKSVWETYKSYDAFTLRDITRQKDNPWEEAYNDLSRVIPTQTIKEFYKNKHEQSKSA